MSHTQLLPALLPFSETEGEGASRHLGIRFNQEGKFLPEPGNTIVCHLTEGSPNRQAISNARSRYMSMVEADRLAFTAESSLHMTLFQGIIEYRRALPYWPADIPLETPIDDMTEILAQRLEHFRKGPSFRVHVTHMLPTGLQVEGVTAQDRAAMAEWRNRLADLFGYRHPDHDSYQFHITFAYVIRPLSEQALFQWQSMLGEVRDELRAQFDHIELDPPAFCAFEDMHHFEELLVLD
ncbi:DUF1868 domain-containing protein [Rhizobium oryziradicis]|uniref:DUF1868 domain-containing protein n=1 Tax=Rhizobium oryziradicis TaxID=1867956 RepID=A0A1Q8ZQP9_9HYPH|nr:DUF1868 domain-containing protein [Rhizobium oryziradicis]OLP44404.1 hypothetical protein BJF95_07675 [Rhizobium oryziradicis]